MLARGAQGRALGNLDDFDKRDLSDMSEDEDENVRRDDTSRYHFGGGFEAAEEVSEERQKSKAEVMAEIIAKSKMYKAERRRDRAEKDELLEELDGSFADVTALLADKMRPTRKAEREAARAAGEEPPRRVRRDEAPARVAGEEEDEFDRLARELAGELKAQAADRLKTPEELARAEHDRLQAAEKARVRRMQGEDDSEEEEEEGRGGEAAPRAVRGGAGAQRRLAGRRLCWAGGRAAAEPQAGARRPRVTQAAARRGGRRR